MLKAYKYRIYPNNQQRELIDKTLSYCRLVYNLALDTKIYVWNSRKISLSNFDLNNQLPELQNANPWLKEVNSQALRAAIRNMCSAYTKFFNHGGGYPKFKNKKGRQSFQCINNARKIDFENKLLTIPKIENIPIALSRIFSGTIKTVTISREPSGKYFASILVDNKKSLPEKQKVEREKTIGIDLGLKDFAILSDGTKKENPRHLRNSLQRLKILQRRAQRKTGIQNKKKAYQKIRLQHEKIKNQRTDFLQKLSSEIVYDSQVTTICMEDLAVKNMMRRAKPKQDASGKYLHNGQAQKRGLNKSIADAGWADFVRMVEYKCAWDGKNFIKIGRFEASTKTCSCCGAVNDLLTLKDREWTCANCGTTHDRDVNGAVSVKEFGLKKYFSKLTPMGSRGEPAEQSAMKGCVEAGSQSAFFSCDIAIEKMLMTYWSMTIAEKKVFNVMKDNKSYEDQYSENAESSK